MKCLICGSDKLGKIPFIHEVSMYNHKSYPIYRCKSCGFARPNPLPYYDLGSKIYDSPENIKFFDVKSGKVNRTSKEYKYYFKHYKDYINKIKEYKIGGKAMDIGCGVGHLMILMKRQKLSVEGLDVSPLLIESLKKDKFKVYCCELDSPKLKNNKYDLITMSQVLEHIVNPEKFLKSVNWKLTNSGYLIMAVPYIGGLIPNILRTYWYGLGYGQHLNFFSKKSLRILLEGNGFEIIELKLLSVDYGHPKFPKVLNFFADMVTKIIVKLNLGDNIFIVAQKKLEAKK